MRSPPNQKLSPVHLTPAQQRALFIAHTLLPTAATTSPARLCLASAQPLTMAPKAEKAPAKAPAKKATSDKKKKKLAKAETYKIYIYK